MRDRNEPTAPRFCTPDESDVVVRAIFDASDDAVIRIDLDGAIVGWSGGASRQYGYSAEEMIGSRLEVLIPGDRAGEFLQMLDDVRSGVTTNHRDTVRLARDGRLLPVSSSTVPLI